MSYLSVRESNTRRVFRLAGIFVVGRGRSCDIVLNDPLSSKRHLEIHQSGDRFTLHDQDSTNGTRIGGQPVSGEAVLKDGDEITVGNASLVFTRELPSIVVQAAMQSAAPLPEADSRRAGLIAATDTIAPVPEGTLTVPLERFGLHSPDFCTPTPQASPESALEFGTWLRSLYSLLRDGNTCENEDDLLGSATRILSDALPAARVRFLFETEVKSNEKGKTASQRDTLVAGSKPQKKETAASGFVVWYHPVQRGSRTSRILDPRLSAARTRLIAYAREQCLAVLSRDIAADKRVTDGETQPKSDEREKTSMLVCPLMSGRAIS